MRSGKTLATFAIIACIVVAACSKNDNSQQNAEAILTTNRWQLTAATVTIPGSSLSVNVYDSLPTCVKDNFYVFAKGGTVTVDEGASKCDESDPQTYSGNWQLLNSNTPLKTIDPITGQSTTAGIINISSSQIVLQDTANYSGYKVNATITLSNVK